MLNPKKKLSKSTCLSPGVVNNGAITPAVNQATDVVVKNVAISFT